jgi:hypothetical protein
VAAPTMVSSAEIEAAYARLLASIGDRADDIGDRPVVIHWPHVGSSYRGLVIGGQALYGWPDDFRASAFRTTEGRVEAIRIAQARIADRPDRWTGSPRIRFVARRSGQSPGSRPRPWRMPRRRGTHGSHGSTSIRPRRRIRPATRAVRYAKRRILSSPTSCERPSRPSMRGSFSAGRSLLVAGWCGC